MSDSFYDTSGALHIAQKMRSYLAIEGPGRVEDCWHEIWIPTDAVKDAFMALNNCVRAADDTKPRGLVIIGESDTGKSRTMKAFRDQNPPQSDGEYTFFPVVLIDAPSKISRLAVLHAIMDQLQAPLTVNIREEPLKRHVIRALRNHRVRLVMIDEFHDISHQALNAEIVSFLSFVKSLINGVGRPFAVSGTPRLVDIINLDPQIAGRLRDRIDLPRFTTAQFMKALLSYELLLPLRQASKLREQPAIMEHIYSRTQGYIGQLSNLLKDACKTAIADGTERITMKVLNDTPDMSIHAIGRRAA